MLLSLGWKEVIKFFFAFTPLKTFIDAIPYPLRRAGGGIRSLTFISNGVYF
jgi:hypothetical protein